MANIITDVKGRKVVEIDSILFPGKRKINWDGVEQYLKKFVGQQYRMDETDEMICIGSDFPDEYANSNYSAKAFGTIGKAKANASQAIPELIKIATNIMFRENLEEKHKIKARYGWYRCTVRFTLPFCDDRGNVIGKNAFQGRMVIRFGVDGKKYLYDMIDIKKET